MNHPQSHIEQLGLSAETPLSISQLNWALKTLVEQSLPDVWAEGEISDLSRPSSGHFYFTLKDDKSQIRAVLWRSTAQRLPFEIEDGMSIVCNGAIEVYPPRGSYQLIVNRVQPQGLGPLQLAFQQLFQKLSKEGLFSEDRKRPLPKFPKRIGFVTSPSGAALHDFLEAARSLWSDFELLVLPVRVQGDLAAAEITNAIRTAERILPKLDLLIVGRGGGSMEDLWCFNDEAVIRALSASTLPTLSAVGHEIDVTLSDLVSDMRALTPTHAAQIAFPNAQDINQSLRQTERSLHATIRNRLANLRQRVETFTTRSVLARPHQLHQQRRQLVDETEQRGRTAIWNLIRNRKENVASLARATEALSPLSVLARGYSLTQFADSQQPIRSAAELKIDDRITTILSRGLVHCRVEELSLSSEELADS